MGEKNHAGHSERAKPRESSPKMRINVTPRSVRFFSPFLRGFYTVCLAAQRSNSSTNAIFAFESVLGKFRNAAHGGNMQKYFSRRSNLAVTKFLRPIRVSVIKYKFGRCLDEEFFSHILYSSTMFDDIQYNHKSEIRKKYHVKLMRIM